MSTEFEIISLNDFLPGYIYREPRWHDEVPYLYEVRTSDYIPLNEVNQFLPGFVYRRPLEDEVPYLISREEGLMVRLI